MAKVKAMVDTNSVSWDLVEVESPELSRGCDEGLFEELDPAQFGKTEDFVPGAIQPCGVGFFVWSTVLAYNADKLKSAPTSWADFWDIKKFPGKRGLRKGAKYTLGIRPDGRRRGAEGRLRRARHQGRPGSRLQEARRDQVEHPVVGGGRPAAAVPGFRRCGDEFCLQRSDRRGAEGKQPEGGMERRHLRFRRLGHPEGGRRNRKRP